MARHPNEEVQSCNFLPFSAFVSDVLGFPPPPTRDDVKTKKTYSYEILPTFGVCPPFALDAVIP